MPTFLELAGAAHPAPLQGQSLLSHLDPPDTSPPRWIPSSGVKMNPWLGSLQSQRFKLIWQLPGESLALYDLATDPAETNNVAELYPEAVKELQSELRAHMNQLGSPPAVPVRTESMDADTIEDLRALGYLE